MKLENYIQHTIDQVIIDNLKLIDIALVRQSQKLL